MMDAFEFLDLPRRPWIEPGEIRAAFQRRARELHPDAADGDAAAFVRLNAAYRELERPALRLRRLLGERTIPAAPPDIALGFEIGATLQEGDGLLQKWRAASAPLARALLAEDIAAARVRVSALARRVTGHVSAAETRLRALDAAWPDVAPDDLAALAGAFSFFDRWTAQLRERAAELAA